jgi:hypothetical protein
MQRPDIRIHRGFKAKSPDPVLEIGRSPKNYIFSVDCSFPSMGGAGVSTRTLSPGN